MTLHLFHFLISVAWTHKMLLNANGEATVVENTHHKWFQHFKNCNFNVEKSIAVEKIGFPKTQN